VLEGLIAPAPRRGIGAIRSFRVQFRSDRLDLRAIDTRARERLPAERVRTYIPQMEPIIMINLKVLSTAAAIALILPTVSAVQAQDRGGVPAGVGAARAGGGGAAIGGGG